MAKDIIVIGASAGGIEALRELAGALPISFSASIFVVQHIAAESPSVLASILARAGRLPAHTARHLQPILPGNIYVAPPDHHLLLDPAGHILTTRGPKENRFRPAVDPLFRSAARAFGPRVIGIVLTGGLDDGTAGLWAIKRRGGTAVVQDPMDALFPSMPLSAIKHIAVDYCAPLAEIGPLLVRLTKEPVEEKWEVKVPDDIDIEVKIAEEDRAIDVGVLRLGDVSIFTCPECHGALLQLKEDKPLRYRCHTGHGFTFNSLLAELTDNIEDSLWTTIRSIQESSMLMRHMADHLSAGEQEDAADMLRTKAQEAEHRAEMVRQVALNHEKLGDKEEIKRGK
jgi:two-component system chemotaxis response regulator CheB